MKKILIFLIILIIASPVAAFSVKDFLTNYRDVITGRDTFVFSPPPICTEGETKCGTGDESSCILTCENGEWVGTSCCAYQCEDGECTASSGDDGTIQVDFGGDEGYTEDSTIRDDTLPIFEGEITQTCSDGTLYNQCSNNKPKYCDNGNLIDKCIQCGCPSTGNYQCIEITDRCVEEIPGDDTDDENRLNFAPIIVTIEPKIVGINKEIQFIIWVVDNDEEDNLTYGLKEIQSEIVSCSITEDIVTCTGIRHGEERITITVSDGIDEDTEIVNIRVLPILHEPQPGVAAGLINTPPTADAGSDKTGFPGQEIILDASKSFDKQGLLSIPETYKWYDNNLIGTGKIIKKRFPLGTHKIKLIVTDSEGLTDEDIIIVTIKEKKVCKNIEDVQYFPEDTICNNIWPINEGDTFKINSITEGSCGLFEVCSKDIDPIIEDSIKCCTEGSTDSNKAEACNFANENSNTFKNCQALYIIKSLGKATYMKGYFDAEMCCKGVESLCPKTGYLYTANPLPQHLKGIGLQCPNTPDNNQNGIWRSDTKIGLNNIALSDVPVHVSLDILGTGTCVDYSVAAATLLRKIGFSAKDVMTVEASDHAYNLIIFDLDMKYTIFDMTGNNDGLILGGVRKDYEYCKNIINCYNDLGKVTCPSNKNINGCENIKERTGRIAGRQVEGVKGTLQNFWEKILNEILR